MSFGSWMARKVPQIGWSGRPDCGTVALPENCPAISTHCARDRRHASPVAPENRTMGTVAELPRADHQGRPDPPAHPRGRRRTRSSPRASTPPRSRRSSPPPRSPRAASSTTSATRTSSPARCSSATSSSRPRAPRRRLPPRPRAQRRPAARLPDRPQALRRDDGRPAERPPGLHRHHRLLPGAAVRREVRALNRQVVLAWRAHFLAELEAVAERYPPREPVDLVALADMLSTTVEGGIVMAKALREPPAARRADPAAALLHQAPLRPALSPAVRRSSASAPRTGTSSAAPPRRCRPAPTCPAAWSASPAASR